MNSTTGNDRALSYGEMIRKLTVEDCDGKPVALTIKAANTRNLAPKNARQDDWKIVIEFAEPFDGDTKDEQRREYVVNSTSYKTLVDRYGSDSSRWIGKPIVMAPTTTQYDGRSYEKMHVAAPERWEKVLGATARARGKK